jgi:hypothetical protein
MVFYSFRDVRVRGKKWSNKPRGIAAYPETGKVKIGLYRYFSP